ncbi:MAG TPA: 30S ribosomal protein S17 [Pyrinomonadaceae bacterium]|nr:30S ribosomal protein S17 [Pyrinomonadaceae bacterium]
MPRKKKEDTVEETSAEVNETESSDETSVEAKADESTANTEEIAPDIKEKPKKASGKKAAEEGEAIENTDAVAEEPSLIGSVFQAVTSVVGDVAEAVVGGTTGLVNAVAGDDTADDSPAKKTSKRAEKIGTVQSDKMTKTVTVRVDRLVKHPMYRKYVKRRKKFMAHDELGAKTGDKVRIIETRPLSAKKRWRVVEIIQKAER